jgi:RNA polymerase sigma factor (sigma-70 family)
MPPSDCDILCAAQSVGDSSKSARQQFDAHFGKRIWYFAQKACGLFHLDPSEAAEIVQNAVADLLDGSLARFDPAHPKASVTNYIRGMVQNAARKHSNFVRHGDDHHHDYSAVENPHRGLPSGPADIADPWDDLAEAVEQDETAVTAGKVMALAAPDISPLLRSLYFDGMTPERTARTIGVDRTTVIRRVARFREFVLASGGLTYPAA